MAIKTVIKALRGASITIVAATLCIVPRVANAAGGSETGLAAVYSTRLAGHKTASGKIYRPSALTIAHKTLPFGTKVELKNKKNGKSVVATVTDRGPRQSGRIADISSATAKALGIRAHQMSEVDLEPQQ